MFLLKDHNAVTPVRLEPAALRSRVKHSTTEPLRSLVKGGTPLSCSGNLFTDVMCTSDSLDSCMAPGFLQTLISIAEVRKKYCSEIESCKSKPMDQKFQLFCVATLHSR